MNDWHTHDLPHRVPGVRRPPRRRPVTAGTEAATAREVANDLWHGVQLSKSIEEDLEVEHAQAPKPVPCPVCGGTGVVQVRTHKFTFDADCGDCEGSGHAGQEAT